jgi:hypothetical protein
MPYSPEVNGQPGLPFAGSNPLSRLASYDGARVAQAGASSKREQLYRWLLAFGPATDRDASEGLGMLVSTINARRNELVQQGRVRAVGLKPGKFRARNTVWAAVV